MLDVKARAEDLDVRISPLLITRGDQRVVVRIAKAIPAGVVHRDVVVGRRLRPWIVRVAVEELLRVGLVVDLKTPEDFQVSLLNCMRDEGFYEIPEVLEVVRVWDSVRT